MGAHAATDFPAKDKPITSSCPSRGGPTDRVARDLAEALRKPLGGATILVDNAAGAGGSIGVDQHTIRERGEIGRGGRCDGRFGRHRSVTKKKRPQRKRSGRRLAECLTWPQVALNRHDGLCS